jgi:hypothetical protein
LVGFKSGRGEHVSKTIMAITAFPSARNKVADFLKNRSAKYLSKSNMYKLWKLDYELRTSLILII